MILTQGILVMSQNVLRLGREQCLKHEQWGQGWAEALKNVLVRRREEKARETWRKPEGQLLGM